MADDPETSTRPEQPTPGDWLVGGGEMGTLIRSMDWSQTPLGPIDSWPPNLRTTVSLALNSNFPISLAWGSHHTQIYNDGYWPICGAKHPYSMGQDFTECWASAFPVIGAAFRSALAGTTAFLEDQRMFLDRLGYLEETFFTFSFSPIRDEHGRVAGLFHPVTETTSKMVGQRRTRTLRDLTARGLNAQSMDDGLRIAVQTLAESDLDVPFVLFYRLDADGRTAQLAAQSGLAPGGAASPAAVDLTRDTAGWPLAQIAAGGTTVQLDDLRERFGNLVCGPYPEPIASAFVQAVTPPGHERPACIMVAGVSTRLPINEAYGSFYHLLAAAVTTVIANALAYEAERRRAEALAEIDRAKTAFFSNVSHEFRTPLTLLLGPLEDELAERAEALPPARRERLEIAHRNSLRLLKLVNTLLDFARIEAGRVQAVYEPTDLAALTIEMADNFRSACERAGLRLSVDCPPLPEPVHVDRDMWEKIVLNLLSNAFKFTFAGEIAVSLTPSGDAVELAVRDTGTGIPAEELPRVFDRFHRVKGARGRTHEGTGIGLALVRELAVLHGGAIRAESELGQGSRFTVSIPAGKAHLPAERIGAARTLAPTALGARPFVEEALRWLPASAPLLQAEGSRRDPAPPTATGPASSPAVQASGTSGRPRIVWADDNADMREYVQRLLSERYDVEAVSDGETALAAARRLPPDLVLSDVMMPRMDGFSLLRELRADDRTRTLPIILLSARAGEESRIEGLEAGADDYLVKPFSARELLARVGTQVELARLRRQAEAARRAVAQAEALQASEARFHQTLDTMLEGCQIIGFDWRYLYINDSAIKRSGQTKDALLGRTMMEVYPGIEATELFGALRRCMEERTPCRMQNWFEYGNGYSAWFDLSIQPGLEGIFVLSIDITERKRAEAALRQSKARFATAFRASPAAMSITRMSDGCFIDVNVSYQRLFGYTRDELIGQTGVAVDIYTSPEQRADIVRRLREHGSLRDHELTLRAKSGQLHAVLFSLESLELDGEACVLGIAFDITERKRIERALQAHSARLRVLADASRAFAEVGAEYQILLDQIGRTTTEVLGEGCSIRLLSDDAVWLQLAALYDVDPEKLELTRIVLSDAPLRVDELSLTTRIFQSGQPLLVPVVDREQVRATTKPEYWSLVDRLGIHSMIGVTMRVQGRAIGVLIVYRRRREQPSFDEDDLNLAQDLADRAALAIGNARLLAQVQRELAERTKAEAEVRTLSAELEQRVVARTAELAAANKELEAFSYSVSHDLRAPLRAIDGFSRILLEEYIAALPDEAQRYFEQVRGNAQQMGRLIDDLLAFARLSRQPLQKQPVEPAALVRQCLDELHAEQDGRQVEIHIGELPACQGDAALLKQVWINLLANALKYTRGREVAAIEIGSRAAGDETIYFVKDNGVGFDMRYSDKLFGVFQRMHRAEDYEGTGVGLAIVQRIIYRHGGRIWAEAEVDRGAAFSFTLGGDRP